MLNLNLKIFSHQKIAELFFPLIEKNDRIIVHKS